MKFYNVSFDNKKQNKESWRVSHKENGNYSVLTCNVDGIDVRVSSTKKMQEYLDTLTVDAEGHVNPVKENLAIVSLTNKALLATKDEKNSEEAIALYVTSMDDEEMEAIKLDNCAAIVSRVSKDKKTAALIIIPENDKWKIRVYQSDKQVFTFCSNVERIDTVSHEITHVQSIKIKKLLRLPRRAFITKFQKGQDRRTVKAPQGFITISMNQILSKNTVISGSSETIEFDTMITEKEAKDVNAKILLTSRMNNR